MTTVKIQVFQNSREINEPSIDCFFDQQEFEFIKRTVKRQLESYPPIKGKVYWASFSVLNEKTGKYEETEEMFKQRIKIQ
jgi:hypothetical protein